MNQRELLERVFGLNADKWLRFARGVLRNREDAEDVIQDAAHRALGCKRTFPTEEEARMYLARIVTNLSFEAYKTRKRERTTLVSVDDDISTASNFETPQALMEQREKDVEENRLLSILATALGRLPAKEYEALRLTLMRIEPTSLREASQSNGIPFSTLRHRRIEGLRRLRRCLRRAIRNQAPNLAVD